MVRLRKNAQHSPRVTPGRVGRLGWGGHTDLLPSGDDSRLPDIEYSAFARTRVRPLLNKDRGNCSRVRGGGTPNGRAVMSVLTPTASLTSSDRLFNRIGIWNRRIHEEPRYLPNRAENAPLNLRRLLADAVAEIAKLKRLVHENANAARILRVELLEAKAEIESLRGELINARAQAVTLRLKLFDADHRLAARRIENPRSLRAPSALGDGIAALIELKRIFREALPSELIFDIEPTSRAGNSHRSLQGVLGGYCVRRGEVY